MSTDEMNEFKDHFKQACDEDFEAHFKKACAEEFKKAFIGLFDKTS